MLDIAKKFYAQLRGAESDIETSAVGDQHHLSGFFGYLQQFAGRS
jgi:hypothetical protein